MSSTQVLNKYYNLPNPAKATSYLSGLSVYERMVAPNTYLL